MRDPELVARAQRAASRLESAWERWRALQGPGETPAQPVFVGYVGYALKEPWGRGSGDHGAADRGLEIARRHVRGRSLTRISVAPAIKPDIPAVTSQLSGSQLGHSFLPGSGARLRITRAG
jgi:hypothetical protein